METASPPHGGDGGGSLTPSRSEVERKLLAGISARRSIRRWVSGTLLAIGLALRAAHYVIGAIEWDCVSHVMESCWAHTASWACSVLALIFLSAAPLKDDIGLTRTVVCFHICVTATQVYFELNGFWEADVSEQALGMSIDLLAWTAADVLFICLLLVAMAQAQTASVQHRLWRALQVFFATSLSIGLLLRLRLDCPCCLLYMFPDSVGLGLSSWPGFRDGVQSKLTRLYDRHSAKAAAASIAGLMGNCTLSEVTSQAAKRFRTIRADLIYEADLAKKDPDPCLYHRSEPARLGSCDAFVSHSWSDNPEGKWEAFQQWRETFVTKHGYQPTIWLDKCCIDQTNIEVDLRCLPIFLSGCKEMVVLCGTTYFSRLWCVVELFTHHHMGLGSSSLTVIPVLSQGNRRGDLDVVTSAVSDFDVAQTQCSSEKDRGQIMEIILASFSSRTAFNLVVREVLQSSGFSQTLDSELGSDAGTDVV